MHRRTQFHRLLGIAAISLLPIISQAQIPVGTPGGLISQQDGTFQVRYASNLGPANDTIFNFTNTGASWNAILAYTGLNGTTTGSFGFQQTVNNGQNICVSIYVYTPDEQLEECCNVQISPNSLWSASAVKELTTNPVIAGQNMSNIVVKMMASSTNSGAAAACSTSTSPANIYAVGPAPFAGAATIGPYLPTLQQGFVSTNPGTFGPPAFGPSYLVWGLAAWARNSSDETPLTNSVLSAQEWFRNAALCEFIRTDGSGKGICHVTFGGQ